MSPAVILIGIVMILALIGMIVCAKKQRTNPNAQSLAVALLIIVVICGIAILYKSGMFGGDSTIENYQAYEQVKAKVLGEAIAKQFPAQKILVIETPNYEKNKRTQAILDSLKEGLGSCQMIVKVPQIQKPKSAGDNPEDIDMLPMEELIKAKDFDQLINANKGVACVVTTFGFPMDIKNMRTLRNAMKPTGKPKFAMLTGDISRAQSLIKSGAVVAVVTYKPGIEFNDEAPPSDTKEAFDKRYILITPKNMAELAKKYKKLFR